LRRTFAACAADARIQIGRQPRETTEAVAVNLTERTLGRGVTVFPVRPAQFIVVPLNQPPREPACAGRTHHLSCQYAAAGGNSPKMPTGDRNRIQSQILATEAKPRPPDLPIGQTSRCRRDRHSTSRKSWSADSRQRQDAQLASQPFRCGFLEPTQAVHHCCRFRPHGIYTPINRPRSVQHHLEHTNGPRLPCRDTAQARTWFFPTHTPSFYSGPTPRLQHFNHLPDQGRHRRPSRLLKPFLR
jgi:hypothetical protein